MFKTSEFGMLARHSESDCQKICPNPITQITTYTGLLNLVIVQIDILLTGLIGTIYINLPRSSIYAKNLTDYTFNDESTCVVNVVTTKKNNE